MKKLLATVLFASILIIHSHGQVSSPSFGNGGKLILNDVINNFAREQSSTLVQSDGKIVMAGSSPDLTSTIICRLNADGTLDNSFGNNGKVILVFTSPVDIKIQTDNKIIVAGHGSVARLNTNGTLDQTFNRTGIVSVSFIIFRLLVQSDQKIILAGKSTGVKMTRLNNDGSADVGFGTSGIISLPTFVPTSTDGTYVEGITQQTDSKIVVSGYCQNPATSEIDFFIARFNINGSFDNTFGGAGLRFFDINNSLNTGYW